MASVATVRYTKGKELTFRLYVLLCDCGCLVFRNLIRRLIKPNTLETCLQDYKPNLEQKRREQEILKEQYDALFPQGRPVKSSEKFDLSLLALILNNVCGLNRLSRDHEKYHLLPNINKIRNTRNALFHDYDTEFCRPKDKWTEEERFKFHWNAIKKALLLLDGGNTVELEKTIDYLESAQIDTSRKEEFKKERKEWLKQTSICNIYGLAELLNADFEEEIFVKTKQFEKAQEKLSESHIIVIKGNPGEGKSITARMLAREVDNEKKWLNISSYTDWRNVNVEQHNVIIDDIFGASSLDEDEFKKWLKYMTEVEAAIQKGHMHAIITSRIYILNEAFQKRHCFKLFDDNNTIQLSTDTLTPKDRKDILENHLRKRATGSSLTQSEVDGCIESTCCVDSKSLFQIGFPECVRLFCHDDTLFKMKNTFFKEPLSFLKTVILALDDKMFLAYFLVWSQNNHILSIKDIEQPVALTPCHILDPIEKLQFDPGNCLREVRRTLNSSENGFLSFDPNKGEYKFSHNVIADVVGLISFERNATAALTFCSYDFIMRFISTQNLGVDNKIYIAPYRYDHLSARLISYMVIRENQINGAAILHEAFRNEAFCKDFIAHAKENDKLEEMFSVPVRSVYAEFANYGIKLMYENSRLPSFSLLRGQSLFTMMCLKDNLIPERFLEKERYLCTLIACKFGQINILKHLFDTGAKLEDEMIIVAEKEMRIEVLEFLRKCCNDDYSGYKSQTDTLISFIRNKSTLAVEILLARHPELHHTKWKNLKCTAMHLACGFGAGVIADMIRREHSELDIKNQDGYYPIHVAIARRHTETVKVLLNSDFENQSSKTLTIERTKSIRGASLLHSAVWKNSVSIVDILTESDYFSSKVDDCDRTAFVFALEGGKHDCIEQLLDKKMIDKEKPDSNGNTPLHIAVKKSGSHRSYARYVELLCQHVNVNMQNRKGNTPLHVACYQNKSEIIQLLREAPGINPELQNQHGKTPAQLMERHLEDHKEEDEENSV